MTAARFAIKALAAAVALAAAALSGAHVAHRSAYASDTGSSFIHNGAWFTTRHAGSVDADARTRALVAATGLLALPRRETVYFRAHKDDAGRPISSAYEYVVEGIPPKARWWSLTIYDGDNYLNRDAAGPYSVKSSAIAPSPDGRVRIFLSTRPLATNWIDMGTGENMSLSLRVYHPDHSLVDNLERAPVFSIKRVSEREGAE